MPLKLFLMLQEPGLKDKQLMFIHILMCHMKVKGNGIMLLKGGVDNDTQPKLSQILTNNGDGKYGLITNLKGDAVLVGFKLWVKQGAWEPMYGRAEDGTWDAGSLVYRAVGDADVPTIQTPPTTGSYLIEVDF